MTNRSTRQPDRSPQTAPGRAQSRDRTGGPPTTLELVSAKLTDVGRARPHNEDFVDFVIPEDPEQLASKGRLFLVADGMGGHQAGEVASKGAVEAVISEYYRDTLHSAPTSLVRAFRLANEKLFAQAQADPSKGGMGTTLVAAVLLDGRVYVANVGDSRAYKIDEHSIKQITHDHSWVEEQVRAGLLTPEQARRHPQRNLVTRALGSKPVAEVDLFQDEIEAGQTLLLCTDGLTGRVSDAEIAATVRSHPPSDATHRLITAANERGGNDNITVLLIHATDDEGAGVTARAVRAEQRGRPGVRRMQRRPAWPWALLAAILLLAGITVVAVAFDWVHLPFALEATGEASTTPRDTAQPPPRTAMSPGTVTTAIGATAPGAATEILTPAPSLAVTGSPPLASTSTPNASPLLYDAPILNQPTDGQEVRGLTTFSWIHTGTPLPPDHVYHLLIWPTATGDVVHPVVAESTTASSQDVSLDPWLEPGKQYSWIVVIADQETGDYLSPTEPSHTFLYQGPAGG